MVKLTKAYCEILKYSPVCFILQILNSIYSSNMNHTMQHIRR